MRFSACFGLGVLSAGLLFGSLAQAQVVTLGLPEIVMTPADTTKFGILGWPDSNLSTFLLNGTYYVFASNANLGATQGLQTPDLNSLKADHKVLKVGALPKGPKGSFDHDYAGGGALYYDAPSGTLIELYHAEYWYGGGSVVWLPAYSSLGMATSTDMGKSWRKLGQVISGAAPRTNKCQDDIGNGSLVYKSDGYLYVYYTDLEASCSHASIGLARAKLSDIVNAAQSGAFPKGSGSVFLKYYNGSFSQPGVIDPSKPGLGGGSFTPVFANGSNGGPAMSSVAYDRAVKKYVMTYMVDWKDDDVMEVGLRFSADGIHWGRPTALNLGKNCFYPSLLNTGGGDPNILGSEFYVYYVNPFPGIATQNLMRVKITLSGN